MMTNVPADLLVAMDQPAARQGDWWSMFVMMGIVFAIMYFVAWRPQQQEQKAKEAMIASLAKDDQVVTTSGLHGRVVEVQGDTLILDVGDKTRLKFDKAAVARKLGAETKK